MPGAGVSGGCRGPGWGSRAAVDSWGQGASQAPGRRKQCSPGAQWASRDSHFKNRDDVTQHVAAHREHAQPSSLLIQRLFCVISTTESRAFPGITFKHSDQVFIPAAKCSGCSPTRSLSRPGAVTQLGIAARSVVRPRAARRTGSDTRLPPSTPHTVRLRSARPAGASGGPHRRAWAGVASHLTPVCTSHL